MTRSSTSSHDGVWLHVPVNLLDSVHLDQVVILASRDEDVLSSALLKLIDNEGTEEAGTASDEDAPSCPE